MIMAICQANFKCDTELTSMKNVLLLNKSHCMCDLGTQGMNHTSTKYRKRAVSGPMKSHLIQF
mgnify:CR=1 FL=1